MSDQPKTSTSAQPDTDPIPHRPNQLGRSQSYGAIAIAIAAVLCFATGVLVPFGVILLLLAIVWGIAAWVISTMEKRDLVTRRPHPEDGRAIGLYLTNEGEVLMRKAEHTASELELEAASRLSAAEKKALLKLLQKVYL